MTGETYGSRKPLSFFGPRHSTTPKAKASVFSLAGRIISSGAIYPGEPTSLESKKTMVADNPLSRPYFMGKSGIWGPLDSHKWYTKITVYQVGRWNSNPYMNSKNSMNLWEKYRKNKSPKVTVHTCQEAESHKENHLNQPHCFRSYVSLRECIYHNQRLINGENAFHTFTEAPILHTVDSHKSSEFGCINVISINVKNRAIVFAWSPYPIFYRENVKLIESTPYNATGFLPM